MDAVATSTTPRSLLTGLGRVTGLLGAYLALVQLLLLARIPGLDLERLARVHRWNGFACLTLLGRARRADHGRLHAR